MEKTENTFRPARFTSLHSTTPQPTTWEEVVHELTDGRHAATTALYRSLLPAKGQESEEQKRRLGRLKQERPAFVPSVSLAEGRTQAHITGYSGFVMVDIDGIPAEAFAATLAKVREDPHSFLVYTTLSGRGIRAIAQVGGEVGKHNFALAWQTVNDYYAHLTGIAIDRQCKNATRMSVICHDPDALYRPEATPFALKAKTARQAGDAPARSAGKGANGRRPSIKRAEKVVRRLVEEEGVRYGPGSHNDYICR
ncbi:BT4734/BF3469 family protein, partial [uncultured Parabacteroides sp.]